MKIESVLVTGASRGIGLEFVRQFSQMEDGPKFIFATYRNDNTSQDLKAIQASSSKSRVIFIKMDVTLLEEIEAAKKIIDETVSERGLNLLINNAAVSQALGFPNITPENLEMHFRTNTVAPIMILQTFLPLLEKAATASKTNEASRYSAIALNFSSMVGSIQNMGVYFSKEVLAVGYKTSKASLNMGMRAIAATVKDKGVLVVNMCPGWVKTDMGRNERGQIEPEDSIADMIRMLDKLDETHHGSFIDRFGTKFPF